MHIPKGMSHEEVLKRRRAVYILNKAGREGKITRQPCEVCGATKVDAHHDDYDQPLQVRWLCRRCHWQHHRPTDAREPVAVTTSLDREEALWLREHAKAGGTSIHALARIALRDYIASQRA